tara:strand:- start:73 stop:702 length:630 start_codon:yes stop_codon:yes gene_type:complete
MAKVKIIDKESNNPKSVITCDHCGVDFIYKAWKEMSWKDIWLGTNHSDIKCPKCGKFQKPTFHESYPIASWGIFIVVGIFLGIFIASISNSDKSTKRIEPTDLQISSVRSAIAQEFNAVIQVIYNNGGIYNWVIVVDDMYGKSGSWKGYARSICNILYEKEILKNDNLNKTIDHRVRIVDRSKLMNSNGNYRNSSLGSTNCKTWEMSNI